MNAEGLLKHYEQIGDAPDAIASLRRFILDLAVRGKLVPQDAHNEPASELLKRIAIEKARLVKAGEIRRQETLGPDIDADDMFDVPKTWLWVPATYPAHVVSDMGKKIQTKEVLESGLFPVVDQGKTFIRGYCNDPNKVIRIEAPLILFGDHTRETKLIDFDFVVGADGVKLLQPICLYTNYYFLALQWLPLDSRGYGRHFKLLRASRIPLPPLAEQHRIVAKVDDLMGLCDQLEAARGAREATRDRLTAASLARLNAPDPKTFQEDARFALDALHALTTRLDQIKQLRQTILNLAVRGKLVPQDSNDESASELLKRIAVERAELVKKKEIRREDPLDPIQSAEMPFDVPARWVWSRIGEAVLFTQYGTSQKSNSSEKGIPVLTMGNVQDGFVVWSNEKRIPETSEDLPALYLRKFDLLYNRTNSAELVGKTGIYLGDDGVRTFASYLIRLRSSLLSTNPRFLNMAMNTPEFRETQIIPLIKKQTGQANVNGTALKNMLIPLPPLAEQHRIVAKVDALMALCDRLEANVTAATATRRRLLDALLADALAPVERELEAAE
jgi:type I restriction enzyme S subunit